MITRDKVAAAVTKVEHTYHTPNKDSPNGAWVTSITIHDDVWMFADVDAGNVRERLDRSIEGALDNVISYLNSQSGSSQDKFIRTAYKEYIEAKAAGAELHPDSFIMRKMAYIKTKKS